ncbi:MAG: hypothetical protein ACXABO_12120 [Promethearchaeota archaeon]|jgi:hypothetical protein
MKNLNTSERSLVAVLVISDIVSVLLLTYNIFYFPPGGGEMIPIFLIIIPAIYFETKKRLESEENRTFRYRKVLWVLISCLITTESMNLILYVL